MTEWRTTPAEELAERLASANADRHRLEVLYEETRREQHRWEDIAAERGTRMDEIQARAEDAEAALADMRRALEQIESAALKAAQLLPMTISTSLEADHRDDHAKWAGWLLRHKVLPVARRALGEEKA